MRTFDPSRTHAKSLGEKFLEHIMAKNTDPLPAASSFQVLALNIVGNGLVIKRRSNLLRSKFITRCRANLNKINTHSQSPFEVVARKLGLNVQHFHQHFRKIYL